MDATDAAAKRMIKIYLSTCAVTIYQTENTHSAVGLARLNTAGPVDLMSNQDTDALPKKRDTKMKQPLTTAWVAAQETSTSKTNEGVGRKLKAKN